MVHLRLQAVRENHFKRISSDWLSDGIVVIIGPFHQVWHHSGPCWPKSTPEVDCDHAIACGHIMTSAHHALCAGHASRSTYISSSTHIARLLWLA